MDDADKKHMGLIDALWHVLNFLAPALGLGLLSASLAKVLWWRALHAVAWWRLGVWAILAASLALLGGLLWTGHDGKMMTYGAMVLASATALWWTGWARR